MASLSTAVAAFAGVVAFGGAAPGQTTITKWTFETTNFTQAVQCLPSLGNGTLNFVGGTTYEGNVRGWNGVAQAGEGINVRTWPAQSTANATAGLEFAVPTTGFTNIRLRMDNRHSNTSTRYVQVLYTTDGTVWTPAPVTEEPQGTPTATTGIFVAPTGDTWYPGRWIDFSSVPAANNNPNFAVRVVAAFNPAGGGYVASNTASTYATTGALRFDNVEFIGNTAASVAPEGVLTTTTYNVCTGTGVTFAVNVTPGQNPASTAVTVAGDLTSIGGGVVTLAPTGTPNQYSTTFTVPAGALTGAQTVTFAVSDQNGPGGTTRTNTTAISATVNVADCTPTTSNAALVISQVFGGGGNLGSPYNADFIEIFNRSSAPQSLDGLALHYAGANSAFDRLDRIIPLPNVVLVPGQHFLVQVSEPNTTAVPPIPALPSPDIALPVAPATDPNGVLPQAWGVDNQNGKWALATGVFTFGTVQCIVGDSRVIDLVGYGTSNCFEGGLAGPQMSNTAGVFRKLGGCQDGNQSAIDLELGAPNPRNSQMAPTPCGGTPTRTLTIVKTGPGSGSINSQPVGVNCGSTCVFSFPQGTQVALTANPALNRFKIGQWNGVAAAGDTYTLTLNADTTVTAFFTCTVDVASLGGAATPDGALTVDDLVFFLSAFFANSPAADFVGPGGTFPRDNANTVDDIVYFLQQFFTACP